MLAVDIQWVWVTGGLYGWWVRDEDHERERGMID
jgi:hypothetical protein